MAGVSRDGLLVLRLGTAQTLAWASTYYLPALLAVPMAQGLGLPVAYVWGAYSAALLLSAALGPFAGRAIDRWGGRPVLMGTSVLCALGLTALSQVQGVVSLVLAWLVIGVVMGSGLYEAAFAALVRLKGREARASITGITLIAGFASTVGWPLSSWMEAGFGWRGACLGWAALHLLLGLPLNASIPGTQAPSEPTRTTAPEPSTDHDSAPTAPPPHPWTAGVLAYVFAATWFVSTAMAAHLPTLLVASGATLAGALAMGALVGPAQVAGRLLEFGLLRRMHPLLAARAATLGHPLGAVCWMLLGPVAGPFFAILHGAGNGILTIAKGTLPLAYFGAAGYGQRQGLIMAPSRVAQAFAPLAFGVCIERWGTGALWISSALGLSAFACLMWLRMGSRR
ncbi:MFS transporter [Hydrogenophaga sp. 2FB]|uniref:MFS transporter n=1 Tax=Hydrogenophaga sp. 2FB TaxID=2502187 RepID=UPI0010F47AED|nr:MFS transporter [Hydrogenophaga sp. 2FB]